MKTFLLLAVSFNIALAQGVKAEDQNKVKPKTRAKVTQTIQTVRPTGPHINHVTPVGPRINHVTPVGPRIKQKTVQTNQYHPRVQSTARIHTKATIPNAHVPRTSTIAQTDTHLRNKNWQNKNNQNTTLQKKNWQNRTWNNNSWAEARRRHHRDHHDRNWWRSHFTRFALFGSGYYFWDNGYWYPAYGYDPGYDTYSYDEPIYGYNDMEPAQVISRVQTELQRLGYYRYAVDGQMGPATRAAIANYQRDNGLPMTSAIDEPTLQSLGLG